MELQRKHAVKFTPERTSRHFIIFDHDVTLALRIETLCVMHATSDALPAFPTPLMSSSHILTTHGVTTASNPTTSIPSSSLTLSPNQEDNVELMTVTDPSHPACGQLALFAKHLIPCKSVICPYTGIVKICQGLTSSRTYAMGYGNINTDFVLDAEFAGGIGRFANDPRNTGKTSNATAESRTSILGEVFTALVAKRTIQPGEEILLDYGKAFALEPRVWMDRNQQVTFRRLEGFLPVDVSKNLFRECTQCGHWSKVCLQQESCCRCGSAVVNQCARVVCAIGHDDHPCWAEHSANAEVTKNPNVTAPWPMNIPFLAWQVWDPLVPLSAVAANSEFRQQESIELYEHRRGEVQIVASRRMHPGNIVLYVGGIVTCNPPSSNAASHKLSRVDLGSHLKLSYPVVLVVTNEAQHVEVARGLGGGDGDGENGKNCEIRCYRDVMGCPVVALTATRLIEAFEPIVVCNSQ